VYKEQIKYHLRGISSEKGWSYLSSKKLFWNEKSRSNAKPK
jgi:hypothetical protein